MSWNLEILDEVWINLVKQVFKLIDIFLSAMHHWLFIIVIVYFQIRLYFTDLIEIFRMFSYHISCFVNFVQHFLTELYIPQV